MEGSIRLGNGASACYRAMTRCECAEISFDEIARRMREEGLTLDQVGALTGCGRCCSACLPDLRAHLARSR